MKEKRPVMKGFWCRPWFNWWLGRHDPFINHLSWTHLSWNSSSLFPWKVSSDETSGIISCTINLSLSFPTSHKKGGPTVMWFLLPRRMPAVSLCSWQKVMTVGWMMAWPRTQKSMHSSRPRGIHHPEKRCPARPIIFLTLPGGWTSLPSSRIPLSSS